MSRRMTDAGATCLSADELADLVALPRIGPLYCELCGEQVPPDERPAPRAEALHCRSCEAGAGLELRSYLSHFSRLRTDQ